MEKSPIFLSFILIVSGLILISDVSLSKLTGNVIGGKPIIGFSFVGFLFLILGIVLFFMSQEGGLEKNLAQKTLESRRVIDNSKDLMHIARKMGYTMRNTKEGASVYDSQGNYLTVIPIHKVTGRTARSILQDLSSGESSFRKRNY
jgi:hypothetical protein